MTLATRIDGHLITAFRAGSGWEIQIDAHIPVMERDWALRSTYYSENPSIAINAAMCEILGYAETVREGRC